MSDTVAIIGAAVGMLSESLRRKIHHLRADMHALTARVDGLAERVARIEGALTGPWRPPANGSPASAPSTPPAAASG